MLYFATYNKFDLRLIVLLIKLQFSILLNLIISHPLVELAFHDDFGVTFISVFITIDSLSGKGISTPVPSALLRVRMLLENAPYIGQKVSGSDGRETHRLFDFPWECEPDCQSVREPARHQGHWDGIRRGRSDEGQHAPEHLRR